jgi:hypothetical protein
MRTATTPAKIAVPHAEIPDILDAAPGFVVAAAAAPVAVLEVLPALPPDPAVVVLALLPRAFCLLYAAAVTVNVWLRASHVMVDPAGGVVNASGPDVVLMEAVPGAGRFAGSRYFPLSAEPMPYFRQA